MTEAELQRSIVKRLNAMEGTVAWKIHGGPHQVKGLPDIVGCRYGLFFGFEVKKPGKERTLTELQAATLKKIGKAMGIQAVITKASQAVKILERYETA